MAESNAAATMGRVVDRYLAAWNEPDADARRLAVAELWTEDGTYTDPLAAVRGHEDIGEAIGGAREMFPGHVFRQIGGADAPHNVVRFGWELVPDDGGESVVVGFDVAVVAEDGRLRDVYGFLDKAPAA